MPSFSRASFLQPSRATALVLRECAKYSDRHQVKTHNILDWYKPMHAAKQSHLARLNEAIPQYLSTEEKLTLACLLREKFYPMPVVTGHPTEILRLNTLRAKDKLTEQMEKLDASTLQSMAALRCERRIRAYVHYLMTKPMRQTKNLTPDEEQDYANYNILRAIATRHDYIKRDSQQYVLVQGGDITEVTARFTQASRPAYDHFRKWAGSDCDGNNVLDAQSMAHIKPLIQSAIVDAYSQRIKPLSLKYPTLQGTYKYLQRCRKEMQRPHRKIIFDQEAAFDANITFKATLDKHLQQTQHDVDTQNTLLQLRDMWEVLGFESSIKQYYRQTSQLNTRILNEFASILIQHNPAVQALLQSSGKKRLYSELSLKEKAAFHQLLGADSDCFESIYVNSTQLSAETQREIDRLNFIKKNASAFVAYILSDSNDIMSLEAVSLLFGYAAHTLGELHINQVRKPPIPLMPLYETFKDIKNRPDNTQAMLKNLYLKRLFLIHEKIHAVLGCSDTGREAGIIAGHMKAQLGRLKDEDILHDMQQKNPELKNIVLEELYGLGGDIQRSVTSIHTNLHTTLQGSAAHTILGGTGAYIHFLNNVVGHPSEDAARIEEFRLLRMDAPETFAAMEEMLEIFAQNYQAMFSHPHSAALLEKLTLPELLSLTNTSTRAAAKVLGNLQNLRAIAWGNALQLGLFFYPMFMSAIGLTAQSSPQQLAHLRVLYQHSTTFRESLLKVMYFICISDFKRAWTVTDQQPDLAGIKQWADDWKSNKNQQEAPLEQFLAWIHLSAYDIMKVIIQIPSASHEAVAILQWDDVLDPSALALNLLSAMGTIDPLYKSLADEIRVDSYPRIQRLTRCIDDYRSTPTLEMIDTILLALRGDRKLIAGPDTIAYLQSPISENYINNPLLLIKDAAKTPCVSMNATDRWRVEASNDGDIYKTLGCRNTKSMKP